MKTFYIVVAEVDMEVDFDYSAAVPGVYSGPWDGSYPDEPEEIDIISVRCPMPAGKDGKLEYVDLIEVLSNKTLDKIKEQISDIHSAELWDSQYNM